MDQKKIQRYQLKIKCQFDLTKMAKEYQLLIQKSNCEAYFFKLNLLGIKFISEYCEGIKLAIKFVDAEAITINNRPTTVNCRLSNFLLCLLDL